MSKFKGSTNLLLQEYFGLKIKLNELQIRQRFKNDEFVKNEIQKIEVGIIEILSMFDEEQLIQIICMGLDIDYDELTKQGYLISTK